MPSNEHTVLAPKVAAAERVASASRTLLSPSSGGKKSEIKVPAWPQPSRSCRKIFLASSQLLAFCWLSLALPLCGHIIFPVYRSVSMSKFPLFVRTPVIVVQKPSLPPSDFI